MKKLTREDISVIYERLNNKGITSETIKDLILYDKENICLGCGCSDNKACANSCYWLEVDKDSGFGICSECEDFMEIYNG